jgi:hypothetical protein
MIPTVLDVKGAPPVPGLRSPGAPITARPVPFDHVLQQMLPPGRLAAPAAETRQAQEAVSFGAGGAASSWYSSR